MVDFKLLLFIKIHMYVLKTILKNYSGTACLVIYYVKRLVMFP